MYRFFLLLALCLSAGLLGCGPDRHICIGGYTTEPPFDPDIRSVYIPVFKQTAFLTSPYRGLDVDLTDAVVKELTSRKTPIRIVSDPARADTELIGTIVDVTKLNYLYNVQGLPRDMEVAIRVDVVWRDLRTGEILTNPRPPVQPPVVPQDFDPNVAALPPKPPAPVSRPISITGRGRLLPELGESNVTASNAASAHVARQIVNLMERAW